jgi:hypothetical protein
MADFNFPSAPNTNDLYTLNGITYRYDGSRWRYANASVVTITGGNAVTTLNSLESSNQDFAVGYSGSTLNISSSGNTHTFNIPLAGNATTGLVSGNAQTIYGVKTFNSALIASDSTNSTSVSTGAVTITGGAGIGQSVSVGGRLQLFNSSNYTAFISSASGNTVYTLPATSPATGSSVLQSTSAGVMSWVPMTATSGSSGLATTAENINTVAAATNATHYILFSPINGGSGVAVSSDAGLFFNPGSNTLTTTTFAAGSAVNTVSASISGSTASTSFSTGALVVTGGVGIGGSVYIQGDLTINGTTTTINSTTLTVDDKNIELGSVSVPSDVTAEAGGITLKGTTDKSINWYAGSGWSSSESWNLSAGNTYKINNTTVLSNSSIGTGITNSSLTALGTISTGVWAGTLITALYGGTGLQTTFTVGDLLYANTSFTWARLTANSNSGYVLTSAGSGATPTYVAQSTLSVGNATTSGTATTAQNINVVLASTNTSHPLLFTPTSGSASGLAVSSNTTLVYNPSTDILSVSGAAITNTTVSISSSSGALIVTGGVGIGQSVSVGGRLQLFNSSNYTAFVSSATGNTVYTLPATSPATGSSVLQSTSAGVMSWVAMAAGAASGNTAQNIVVNTAGNVNVFHPMLFTPSSLSAGSAVSSDSTITFNPSTEILNVSGLAITSGTASTNTTTGALVVRGGLGVTGQLSFATASFGFTGIATNPSMSFIGATTSSPITLTVLTDNSLNFEGSQGSVFSIDSNLSSGEIFSVSDISGLPIISASAGQTVNINEFGGYTQIGNGSINSSSTTTGSLVIAGGLGFTGNAFIGGTTTITNGTNSTSTGSGSLVVRGGVGITGNAFIGGTTTVTNTTASTNTVSGAFVVSGGVGVGLSASIGGRLQLFNGANYTAFVSSASGNTVYTLPATSPATGSSILVSSSAGVMSWASSSSLGNSSGGTADGSVQYKSGSGFAATNSFFYDTTLYALRLSNFPAGEATSQTSAALKVEQTTGTFSGSINGTMIAVNANNGFTGDLLNLQTNAITKFKVDANGAIGMSSSLTTAGDLSITSTTQATNTTTGALQIRGGVGITGNAFIGGTTTITNTTASVSSSSGALVVAGGAGIAQTLFVGGSISNAYYFYSGGNNFTKSGQAQGDIFLDNNSNDTPGVLYYYKNNTNFGIDAYATGIGSTRLRIVRDLNESTGAEIWSIDRSGVVTRSAWDVGEVINTRVYNNSDLGMSATTTINSTTYTNVAVITYTPKSSTSHLWIEFDANYDFSNGTTTDDFFSRITVGGSVISERNQIMVGQVGGGTRSGVIFPISGRYTNSSTSGIAITVQAKWGTADDAIRVYGSSTSGYMRIQEIGR